MRTVTALIIKFIMVAVILGIVLNLLTSLSFGSILVIAAAVTIIAYFIGDLIILGATNNTTATIADIVLVLVVIWLFNFIWGARYISFTDAIIAAVAIGTGEWFFHKYVANNVFPKGTKD